MKLAAFALAAVSLSLVAVHAPAAVPLPAPAAQKLVIDARGPLALVEVTRTVVPERAEAGAGHGSEAVLDLALPEGSALVALEVRDGSTWRTVDPVGDHPRSPTDAYRAACAARGVTPASEISDEGSTHRLRLLRSAGHRDAPFTVHYRFAILPLSANGQLVIRFPAAPERLPPPAEVTLKLRGAADAEIAGVRTTLAPGAGIALGHASTRSAWEVAWTPRDPATRDGPPLEARLALAPLSPTQTALAFLARHRPGPVVETPGSVLFLVDRSRSVGLPGLSAERDLVRALIEALPPSTRFDALFFARATNRLFPMSRPATREAIESFENEMVPDRLQNGTDLPGALRDAGALLRREVTTLGPRALLVLVTDGAIDDHAGLALDGALGPTPGLDLGLAALTIRPVDDEPVSAGARETLSALAAARGGVARELRANEIGDAVPALLADLRQGGDLGAVRLVADGKERRLAQRLPPGAGLSGVVTLQGRPPRAVQIASLLRGQRVAVAPAPLRLAPEWLRPWVAGAVQSPRFLDVPSLVALVEPVLPAVVVTPDSVVGSMDRMVVRNVLSLAYMPRARACYLNRTAATPALRDLAGKVRLSIELARGEVGGVKIESSTLGNPEIERCLQESAFEIEIPRAARSDAPVTAVLNMNFLPRTPDKKADVDLGEIGNEIDLVIEEMHRREGGAPAPPPTAP